MSETDPREGHPTPGSPARAGTPEPLAERAAEGAGDGAGDGAAEGTADGAGPSLLGRFPALGRLRILGRRRGVPHIQQTTSADCGAACLAMVLAYHGKQVRLDEVRDVAGAGTRGLDALTLLQVGRWYGLRGRGVKVPEIAQLAFLPPGSILHWGFRHFVVFERWRGEKGAEIVDPAAGRLLAGTETLRRAFTGVALTFEPGDDFEPGRLERRGVGRYLRQIFRQSGLLSRVVVLSVLVQLFALAVPVLTGLLVDRVVPREDQELLAVVGVGLVGVALFYFLAWLLRDYLLLALRTRLDTRMTLDFLDHLVDLPYAFFQQRSAGDLMMRLNSNSTIRELLTTGALSGILDGSLVLLYLAVLFVVSPAMGWLVLGLGMLRVGVFFATRRRQRELMSEALEAEARSRGYQVQMLVGMETLKAAGAEKRSVELWSNLFVDELNVVLDRGRLDAWVNAVLNALAVASPLAILVLGGSLVLEGSLSLGTMLAASALAGSFLVPLTNLVNTSFQLQRMGSYLERLNDVLEAPKEQDRTAVVPAGTLAGHITLEHVSFRYTPLAPMVIKDVSLEIPPGQFIAVVGLSGSGKSTLASLLVGLFLPTSGRVLYDGVDLARLDFRSLRRQIGYVPQAPYLFGSSIRSNIAIGEPSVPYDRVVEAARQAEVHDEIMALPMGYETLLADGGSTLSGGQRQRIALARALLRQPAILLLDEATSSLDALTEERIHRRLSSLRSTRIVIAHRLSTVREADRILVMDDGVLVEGGTHAELLARGGRYAELVATQLAGENPAV